MLKFLTGMLIGWLLGSWYTHRAHTGDGRLAEYRSRASAVLDESARIVDQSRRELQRTIAGDPEGGDAGGGDGPGGDGGDGGKGRGRGRGRR